MWITFYESEKRMAISFPADRTALGISAEVHDFDYSLLFGVYQLIHVSSMLIKHSSFGLRIKGVKYCCEMFSLLYYTHYLERAIGAPIVWQLSHVHYFIQWMIRMVLWDVNYLSYSYTFSLQSVNTKLRTIDTSSYISKTDMSPRWNLLSQFLAVPIEEEELL